MSSQKLPTSQKQRQKDVLEFDRDGPIHRSRQPITHFSDADVEEIFTNVKKVRTRANGLSTAIMGAVIVAMAAIGTLSFAYEPPSSKDVPNRHGGS